MLPTHTERVRIRNSVQGERVGLKLTLERGRRRRHLQPPPLVRLHHGGGAAAELPCVMACNHHMQWCRLAVQKELQHAAGHGSTGAPPAPAGICCSKLLHSLTGALCRASQRHHRLPLLLHQRTTGLAA